jgi:hypothetical protein
MRMDASDDTAIWRSRHRQLAARDIMATCCGSWGATHLPRSLPAGVGHGSALAVHSTAAEALEDLGYAVEGRSAELVMS